MASGIEDSASVPDGAAQQVFDDEDANSRQDELQENEAGPTESFADAHLLTRQQCVNCRQRKVKCDRVYPCYHCVKTNATCVFLNQKRRIKRQRIHISEVYENKIDHIALKIEELSRSISLLNVTASQSLPPNYVPTQLRASQSSRSNLSPDQQEVSPGSSRIASSFDEVQSPPPVKPEYEGESSLSAHAAFATKFIQSCVSSSASSTVVLEMSSVLDTLKSIVDAQKQKADTLETLYPYARPLGPGASLRQLPAISTETALSALRMVQENARIRALWLMDVQTLSQFTGHFIKVCSPGPATEADLIIVYAGFYWLFEECANASPDEATKQEYTSQVVICRDNLETTLSRLPFHLVASLDNAFALTLATLYCLEKCKPAAAWAFICTASQQSQALGLHSALALQAETSDARPYRLRLFWTIYTVEKTLAFRLGRSSTIRDNDISIPRVDHDPASESSMDDTFSFWIELSSLQGRVYEQVYSPISLTQPQEERSARARVLANQARAIIEAQDEFQRKHHALRAEMLGQGLAELFWRADRVTGLSMLTLIYRSIPPEDPSKSVFCEECLAAAKDALTEHEKCVAILTNKESQPDLLELYVNWALLQSPFTPFIVLFCHIIETSDPSDLECLRRLVEILQIASTSPHQVICQRQLRLFKALYEVAVRYLEIKADHSAQEAAGNRASAGGGGGFRPHFFGAPGVGLLQHESIMPPTSLSSAPGISYKPLPTATTSATSTMPTVNPLPGETAETSLEGGGDGESRVSQLNQQHLAPGGTNMELDQSGSELATWFYLNDQMIRMLGET